MDVNELIDFQDCVRRMLAAGRVPNFAFWPDRTILYVGMPEEGRQMRFPPRIEVPGPFEVSALVAAQIGVEKAEAGDWQER